MQNLTIKAENLINLNQATLKELESLPGIGPVTAKKILELRERKGGFKSVDELLEVPGIGPKKLEALKPYLTLEEKSISPDQNQVNYPNPKKKIFKYIDEKGVVHYTQFPEMVPFKYRHTLKEVH